ncbi:hypothetical protein [uncultured Porticoccus sp.]|uniref:hypothetical protein n=1 Tax=uncultured Porticoccus sp. TaxID=1256050 RepID=UPI0030D96A46|tara:strand:+ start:190 stop:489 length:300 start_codon:yes stop_codon:yes gene_type:complete
MRKAIVTTAMTGIALVASLAFATTGKPIDEKRMVFGSANTYPFERLENKQLKKLELAYRCSKSGEQTSGRNKICYYNCMGSTVAITISNPGICPLTINR